MGTIQVTELQTRSITWHFRQNRLARGAEEQQLRFWRFDYDFSGFALNLEIIDPVAIAKASSRKDQPTNKVDTFDRFDNAGLGYSHVMPGRA